MTNEWMFSSCYLTPNIVYGLKECVGFEFSFRIIKQIKNVPRQLKQLLAK